jgi:His-Xaa-Ser system protein HxsD
VGGSIALRVPKADYAFDTLVRVAHRMGHFFSISVVGDAQDWVLSWDAPEALGEDSVKRVRNEIYDQILRDRIHGETKPIRDLIFAAAFSNLEIK